MAYVGILPFSYLPNGEIAFLLGKEAYVEGWNDSMKWSGFGGSLENTDKSIYEGIAREGYEESMGFIGTYESILDSILAKGVYINAEDIEPRYQILSARIDVHDKSYFKKDKNLFGSNIHLKSIRQDKVHVGYTAPLKIPYDSNLPDTYIRVYDYVRESFNGTSHPEAITIPRAHDGYYEKIEIDWFTYDEIVNSDEMDVEFRPKFLRNFKDIMSIWNQ